MAFITRHKLLLVFTGLLILLVITLPYLYKPESAKDMTLAKPYVQSDRDNVKSPGVLPIRKGPRRKILSSLGKDSLNSKLGYIVALVYSGQQGAGIQALTSLQCWAGSFHLPMSIMEPLIMKTAITAMPKTRVHDSKRNQTSIQLSFGDFFDLEYFNSVSKKNGYAQLASREEFFKKAPRKTIVVIMKNIPRNTSEDKRVTHLVWSSNNSDVCYQSKQLPQLQPFTKQGFCIIRVISSLHSFARSSIFSADDMKQTIFGSLSPSDVTLIFTIWRTPWYVPVKQNSKDKTIECKRIGNIGTKHQFQPSQRLLDDVMRYEQQFLDSHNTLAVMLRIERMLGFLQQYQANSSRRQASNGPWTVDKCLNQVVKLTKQLQKKRHYGQPYVTLDVGKYGSKSWNQSLFIKKGNSMEQLEKQAKLTLMQLYSNQWTFEQWETSFSKAARGVENSGYIAAVQRTIASRAECLVLVGGGTFQDLALQGYMYNHPDRTKWCIHLICVLNEKSVKEKIDKGAIIKQSQ